MTEKIQKSPCINVCEIDPDSGYCKGCYRNLHEIATWSQLDENEKSAVYLELKRRKNKFDKVF